jgi:hypothetical protein
VANSPLSNVVSIEGDEVLFEGTAADPDSLLNVVTTYNANDVSYLVNEFTDAFEEKAIIELNTLLGTIYKVPNSRIYFYTGAATLDLDYLALADIVDDGTIINDLAQPFTFVASNAGINMGPMTQPTTDIVNAMIIANGDIHFTAGNNCDDSDVFKGLFITPNNFTTEATRNDDTSNTEWCAGGNMIIEGGLVGNGIGDTFFQQRRSTTDYREGNTIETMFGAAGNFTFEARKLFNLCYLPSILEGVDSPYCDILDIHDDTQEETSLAALSDGFYNLLIDELGFTTAQVCPDDGS